MQHSKKASQNNSVSLLNSDELKKNTVLCKIISFDSFKFGALLLGEHRPVLEFDDLNCLCDSRPCLLTDVSLLSCFVVSDICVVILVRLEMFRNLDWFRTVFVVMSEEYCY